jgi:hypothetical protein
LFEERRTVNYIGVAINTVLGASAILLRDVLVPELGVVGDTILLATVDHSFAVILNDRHFYKD